MSGLVLSLFPGIGLLDRAFEEEGFCVVRGPDVLWGGDIKRFHPPAAVFQGVIGGPPCQCFSSLAHLVRANGYEPRFGNLIPEYERCVGEAQPVWFLMENVPKAPIPQVKGFSVSSFLFNNSWLGEEQIRKRRFSFGLYGDEAPNLLRWIQQAPLELPKLSKAVVGDLRDTPVAIGGSGKVKVQLRTITQRSPDNRVQRHAVDGRGPGHRHVKEPVTSTHRGGLSVKTQRYKLADACRLQGLPEEFLAEAPFTAQGKLSAVANGVPLPMGRALARAVKAALLKEKAETKENPS